MNQFIIGVSILLYRWIPLEDGYPKCFDLAKEGFQSFCIVGFLWKLPAEDRRRTTPFVSILLYRWIPLEVQTVKSLVQSRLCFNPSVSLDSSGSQCKKCRLYLPLLFQSFCIVGFLWKPKARTGLPRFRRSFNPSVSLDSSGSRDSCFLVGFLPSMFQSFCIVGFLWKTLPVPGRYMAEKGFNPSVSLDSSGSFRC